MSGRGLDRVLGARLPDPPEKLRVGPFREGAFPSPLHSERTAAQVGAWLGMSFTICFLTGLISHFIQQPTGWWYWPAHPAWLYRVTQGVHVATGIAAVPLLLVKLWTVYPKLFEWPPAGTVAKAISRLALLVLVGSTTMQLVTGLINISEWYPFGFFFTSTHYWTGWIAIGAIFVHVGAKAPEIRRGLSRQEELAAVTPIPAIEAVDVRDQAAAAEVNPGLPRRTLLMATGASVAVVTLATVGQTVSPLAQVSVLSPRIPGVGPQGVPVRQTAAAAGVEETAADPAWRLTVDGPTPLSLSLADLQAMPQHTARLPITCVEGWSSNGTWTGVRVTDLLVAAGLAPDARVRVESLQTGGLYRVSMLEPPHAGADDTLLALQLHGEPLAMDHGFPLRLIAPNRPGVLQTKWVTRMGPA